MTLSLKQYNKVRLDYSGEPKKGEVWEIIEKSNSVKPYYRKVPVIVLSNKEGKIRTYICTNWPSREGKQYEIKDPRTAGVFDKSFVNLDVVTFSRDRMIRKIGRLSGFDKNLIMFS